MLDLLEKNETTEILETIKISKIHEDLNHEMSFKNEFQKEKIEIREIDYYFSNAISRASKTMSDCRSIQKNKLLEGTNY